MKRWRKLLAVRRPRVKRTFGVALAVLALALLLGAFSLYRTIATGLPDVDRLESYQPPETSRIFSADGQLVAALYDEHRTYARLHEISPYVVRALTATEDSRFFEHSGVDPAGILRAAIQNWRGGEVEQGASTLTMQLTRELFLTDERTVWRKAQEAVLAWRIERRFEKDRILELYLNEVYFGSGAHGIQAAAGRYFGKRPRDLGPAEAALLVGVLQAPSRLSPHVDPEAARARQLAVLERMRAVGGLPGPRYQEAVARARAMRFAKRDLASEGLLKYPYFTSYVVRDISRRYGERVLRRGGLRVRTSLDLEAQRAAEEILRTYVETEGPGMNVGTGAVVLLDNETGHIRAMAGGLGHDAKDRFNRAWQARRQPGSAFKPFVYAAALEAGYSPESEVPDERVVFFPDSPDRWEPRNADGRFMGRMPLRAALMYSRNVVAVRLLNEIGFDAVLGLTERMGMEGPFPAYLSLALGTGDATPLEMAEAFAVFAGGGVHRPASPILVIEDSEGNLIEDLRALPEERVLSGATSAAMAEMLRRVVVRGTGTGAWLDGQYAAGKTGTTDDFRDAWFIGFTPRYTAAVWVGNDDNSPTWGVYGGTLPASIWREFMASLPASGGRAEDVPRIAWSEPRPVRLCGQSHFVAGPGCNDSYQDEFRTAYVAAQPCPLHWRVAPVTPKRISVESWPLAPSTAETPTWSGVSDHPKILPEPPPLPDPNQGVPTAPRPATPATPSTPATPAMAPTPAWEEKASLGEEETSALDVVEVR